MSQYLGPKNVSESDLILVIFDPQVPSFCLFQTDLSGKALVQLDCLEMSYKPQHFCFSEESLRCLCCYF